MKFKTYSDAESITTEAFFCKTKELNFSPGLSELFSINSQSQHHDIRSFKVANAFFRIAG